VASKGEGLWGFREPPSALRAESPDRYVAQHLAPLFFSDRLVSSESKTDREVHNERDFGKAHPRTSSP
jgi:hypothetical protein